MASRSAAGSDVTVELRMSKASVDESAHLEAARIAGLDPGAACPTAEDVGSAVPTVPTLMAAITRVEKHGVGSNRLEFVERIEDEVDAVFANRSRHLCCQYYKLTVVKRFFLILGIS